jgi:CIC family chloride channel protein
MGPHITLSPLAAEPGALPVAPSLTPAEAAVPRRSLVDRRVVFVSALAVALGLVAAAVAQLLTRLIGLTTNLCFFARWSTELVSPAGNRLGPWVVLVPVAGALLVGLMARYGSRAIRGHGIPEAMEQVLINDSRIAARVTLWKPLSAAISIGSGGPFGAEGPIIATGGALGSLLGQRIHVSAQERKTLLAAGAAAGMAATFGSPLSALLLAVELLLFEYRPRSLIPVALAAVTATAVRYAIVGAGAVFAMPALAQPGSGALVAYVLIGAIAGLVSVAVTRAVYAVEDAFERLPIHWMWWPALGAIVVGVVGWMAPRTLGVGYDNLEAIVTGSIAGSALAILCGCKLISWTIALGSGTSGGTLAPLFTVGGGLGALLGSGIAALVPSLGVDPRLAGLVGMAAMFAGASRALLASVVFAYETTRQPVGLLPLLGGGAAAYLVACLAMRNSIMTEKIARRGVHVAGEYVADFLASCAVAAHMSKTVVTLAATTRLVAAREYVASAAPGATHQGFPIVDGDERIIGVLTRRDLLAPHTEADAATLGSLVHRRPLVLFADQSLRDAVDLMARHGVGRLPVVAREAPARAVGILTRGDILAAEARRLTADGEHVVKVAASRRRSS